MKLKIETTFEQFFEELEQFVDELRDYNSSLIEGAEEIGHKAFADLPSDIQYAITSSYESIDEFCLLTEADYAEQIKNYEKDHMGEDAKVGDVMFNDNSCFVGILCVTCWKNQATASSPGQEYGADIDDVLDPLFWTIVLREFERLIANQASLND